MHDEAQPTLDIGDTVQTRAASAADRRTRLGDLRAAAALAQARRLERLSRAQQRTALNLLDEMWDQLQLVDIDESLVHRAGVLADLHNLRGHDATHCAGAESINDADVFAASGDRQLLAAWRAVGINTLDVNNQ